MIKLQPLHVQPVTKSYHGRHRENLFCASSPEPKGQLCRNLVGTIGPIYRSIIDKMVPTGNLRWPPS